MKNSGVLAAIALPFAVVLSASLAWLGFEKFQYIMAGGKKFSTFPDLESQLWVSLSYLGVQLIYLIWVFATPSVLKFPRFSDCVKSAGFFLLLALIAYPISNDVYLYLHFGLMDLEGLNPFLQKAGLFVSQLSYFVDWGQTSTYGPVSQLFFAVSAIFVKIHPILAIYIYKGFCLGLHVFNAYLIWRSLISVPERGKLTLAYLLNPLLLMEQVGAAHVDVLVSTSLLILIISLTQQRYFAAFVAMWAGVLSKTLPIIWIPLVSVFLIRQRRWKSLAWVTLFSLALLIALVVTMFYEPQAWMSLLNPGVAGQSQASLHRLVKSLLTLIHFQVPGSITLEVAKYWVGRLTQLTLAGFAVFYAWVLQRICFKPYYNQENLITDIGWVTLTLFLIATPWLMPWYVSVLLPVAALVPRAQLLGLTTLMFTLSSSATYLLHGFMGLKSLVSIGIPLVTLVVGAILLKSRSPALLTTDSSSLLRLNPAPDLLDTATEESEVQASNSPLT